MASIVPFGFVSLVDALTKIGASVVPNWSGDEIRANLWAREDPRGLIEHRLSEAEGWLGHELVSRSLELWVMTAKGPPQPLKPSVLRSLDVRAVNLTGRLTRMTRQKALDWLDGNAKMPKREATCMVLLKEDELQAALDFHLRSDDSADWSFAGLLAWICWRRHDMVRSHAPWASDFLFQDLRNYYSDGRGIIFSGPDALKDLWSKLSGDKIRATGVPARVGAPRTEIPPREWQDYALDSKSMVDAIVFLRPRAGDVAYYSPSVLREDALKIWGPVMPGFGDVSNSQAVSLPQMGDNPSPNGEAPRKGATEKPNAPTVELAIKAIRGAFEGGVLPQELKAKDRNKRIFDWCSKNGYPNPSERSIVRARQRLRSGA